MALVIRIVLTNIIVLAFAALTAVVILAGPYDRPSPFPAWFWWMTDISFLSLILMRVWRK
jgi:hypothetical protein